MEKRARSAQILFQNVLELPPGPARQQFLAKHCAIDPELRREVESLLQAHEDPGNFLNPEAAPTGSTLAPREAMSRYALAPANAANRAADFLRTVTGSANPS